MGVNKNEQYQVKEFIKLCTLNVFLELESIPSSSKLKVQIKSYSASAQNYWVLLQ